MYIGYMIIISSSATKGLSQGEKTYR